MTFVQKSKSNPGIKSSISLGPKRHMSLSKTSCSLSKMTPLTNKDTWRSPGYCEIPNILGHAYLGPDPPAAFDLRPLELEKRICKRPWYPPSPHYNVPQLPPLTRHENKFERIVRKMLPKQTVRVSDPRTRYDQFKEIGTGVNGAVVRANDRRHPGVQVAIKRCKLDPDQTYRAAILREIKIMAGNHENLIKLREVTLWRDAIWISMDLMRCSVFAVLCRRAIPEEHTIHIARQTLYALIYLHSKGVLHRDIKCENLLLGWQGQVKLADFGLSARVSRHQRDRLGTSKWMAPEVIRQECYTEKIDMWSLGITIIEMMDRVPPHYLIKDEEELFDVVITEPSPTFTYSYPSMYMRGLVAWLLDMDPLTRPSAQDVLLEIDTHVSQQLLPCSSSELVHFLEQSLT
ncbi:kinase-like domain-containing protein [Spinellus fusiger]|nr:kinase-like domain-containing protein [Spinellus fusiger]KAI7870581.1 kinase-like domain-containing protein [Spinellus fusiger]